MRVLLIIIGIIILIAAIGYIFLPDIVISIAAKKIPATPRGPDDPFGYGEVLHKNPKCVKKAIARKDIIDIVRGRPQGEPPLELLEKIFPCTTGGQEIKAALVENEQCFVQSWGQETYNDYLNNFRFIPEDLMIKAAFCLRVISE